MKKEYTALFFDYYGNEIDEHAKTFSNFTEAAIYFAEVCDKNAIPFAQLCRNGQVIALSNGRRIGRDEDSRRW